jgi:hypothetical protein
VLDYLQPEATGALRCEYQRAPPASFLLHKPGDLHPLQVLPHVRKLPYWHRSNGSDHFWVGPAALPAAASALIDSRPQPPLPSKPQTHPLPPVPAPAD